jgi:chromate reductase, NAD(P)H dehydrogenase (quinone)
LTSAVIRERWLIDVELFDDPHLIGSGDLTTLSISGTLRNQSHYTAVLHKLSVLLLVRADFQVHPLYAPPLYYADLDVTSPPDSVRALKDAITTSDGLVICLPQYNYGMPCVLKNAIEWASRPGFNSPLKG